MMKLICDRCGAEWVGDVSNKEGIVHIGEKWYDLCPGCVKIYQSIEDKVIEYRKDLYVHFLEWKEK